MCLDFLAAQAQKFSPRTILFDKDRGAEVFVRGIGGRYTRISAGQPTGFNPLALPDTSENRAFLRDWFAVLLGASGAEEHMLIAAAVDAAYANDARLRRLGHFRELLAGSRRPQPGDLASRLDPWINEGEHAWLFDNAHDRLDLSERVIGFDMTALLESPRLRPPTMMYLFHRIEERLDGTPAMILIDEGWKALDDDVFAARIRDWLKTLRKRTFAALDGANFTSARLAGANLAGVSLTNAKLAGADLSGADLTDATLANASLVVTPTCRARLSSARPSRLQTSPARSSPAPPSSACSGLKPCAPMAPAATATAAIPNPAARI